MKRHFQIACMGILALGLLFGPAACNNDQEPGNPKQGTSAEDLVKEAHNRYQSLIEVEDGEDKEAQLDEVERMLRKAVELAPEKHQPHVALTKFMWDRGDQLAAVKKSGELVKDFAQAPSVWDLEGDLRCELSQWKLAEEAYFKALELGGDEMSLQLKIGRIKGLQRAFEDAFEAFDRAKELGAPKDVVNYNLALCYEGTECPELAMEYYEKSLAANPNYTPSLSKMAEMCQSSYMPGYPDINKALEYAQKAYETSPKDVKVLADLADILVNIKDYERALQIVKEALVLYPDNPELVKFETYLNKLKEEQGP